MISWRELVELYRVHDQAAFDLKPRYNVAPSQDIPIVRPTDDRREIVLARWGLVPGPAKRIRNGDRYINVKAETVDKKVAFRSAFESRRCLVPADGYYEWKKVEDGGKQPHRLCLANRRPFAFAGLWERNDILEVTSSTIVTTMPNEVARAIHDRMPVILPPNDYEAWLSHDTPPADAKALLRPYEGAMIAYPVSKEVDMPNNDRPELIEEVHVSG